MRWGGSTTSNADVATQTGAFINSPTKGIKYSASPSGLSGTTDAAGTYSYKAGDTITFSLDLGASTLTLGSTSNPSSSTSVLALTVPNGSDPLSVAQVLETLDKSSEDGKMDVSGIALSAGTVLTAITNAITSTSVSAANIATIATGVQTALTAANGGNLKYGNTGVAQNDALSNLSRNSANQSLLETKVQNLSYDGSSTVLNVQDKTAFTNWIIKNGSKTEFSSRLGQIASIGGLTYEYKSPYDINNDASVFGTYVLANSNRTGNFTTHDGAVGTFSLKTGDTKSYSMTYTIPLKGETGAITGVYLLPLTLNDVVSKSYVLYGGCSNGTNSTVTIDSNGRQTGRCGTSDVNTWAVGPFTNTLKYTESNGTRHYIGITRLDKKGGTGNLPSGAVGSFVDISSKNFDTQPDSVSFKVN